MRILTLLLLLCLQQTFSYAQTPCSGGSANGFACSDVDLQSLLSVNALGGQLDGSDIWGWTDPSTNKEYALVGIMSGTSFVDITNPSSPIVVGYLPSNNTNSGSWTYWRDIKVINNYAYIVAEESGHGMQIFDLTRLRTATPGTTFNTDGRITYDNGTAHNVVALEETGHIVVVGTNRGFYGGGMLFYDVNANPTNPTFVGAFSADGYTHDAMCFVYRGPDKNYIGREICIGYNEDTNTIVDATDKTNITQISKTPYTGSNYTHQGWITDDHRYMLVNDEGDEQSRGHNTRTYIFDISDLDNPSFLGYYEHPFAAIDHNLYIKGRYAYLANYRSGLRILDIGDIANANLTEIAGFDTYQPSNSGQFNGAWSNYPYFKSGNVIVSDIEEGLFVLKPKFAHYSFSFNNAADGVIRLCPGATETFTVNIDGYEGYSSNVSLSLSGLDPGLTATLSSNSVAPGGSVTITVTAANGGMPSCAGNFCVLLTGNQGDANTEQSIALGIVVDDTLPGCSAGSACPTCDDGIMNQDETDIDCGGTICDACPTCNDGMMNGNETGIDCGGPDCPECTCGGIALTCDTPYSGDTNGSGNDFTSYNSVANTYPGQDEMFEYIHPINGPITINLFNLSRNLDMIIMQGCDPATATLISEERTNGAAAGESYTNANLPAGTYYIYVEGRNANRTATYTIEITNCPSAIRVAPKVFLQGAFNTTDMNLGLGTMMPSMEPYTGLGYTHVGGGGETVSLSVINSSNVIDWVVVELRDKNNPATVLATRSALLLQDGSVVNHLDGTSAVEIPVAADDYYIAIRHRNHLGVMTDTPVSLN